MYTHKQFFHLSYFGWTFMKAWYKSELKDLWQEMKPSAAGQDRLCSQRCPGCSQCSLCGAGEQDPGSGLGDCRQAVKQLEAQGRAMNKDFTLIMMADLLN